MKLNKMWGKSKASNRKGFIIQLNYSSFSVVKKQTADADSDSDFLFWCNVMRCLYMWESKIQRT